MISVRMREQNHVDVMDALPNQERHDDALADGLRDRRAVGRLATLELPAGVDHQRVPARRLHEDCIALADIDERDAQIVARRPRRPQHQRTRQRDDGERRDPKFHRSFVATTA